MKPFVNNRGISTVIGAALMLSAVAVLGSTMVLWSYSTVASRETNLATTSAGITNKINEFLSIENVWFCQTTCPRNVHPAANITMTNIGSVGLNVTQIKLKSQSASLISSFTNGSINVGKSFSWDKGYVWSHNVPVNVTVTTARGTIFTAQVTPP